MEVRAGVRVGRGVGILACDFVKDGGGVDTVAGWVDSIAALAAEEGEGMREEEGSRPISPSLEEDEELSSMGVEETAKKKKM